jgi:hypothetical protein
MLQNSLRFLVAPYGWGGGGGQTKNAAPPSFEWQKSDVFVGSYSCY